MAYYHFANGSKKVVSIVLLLIIFSTTISYAVVSETVIDALYNEVISEDVFMTKLYQTGPMLEVPLLNDEINKRIKKFITFVMNESQRRVDNGEINRTNYRDKIKAICVQKVIYAGLDQLFITAYPEIQELVAIGEVPTEMEPMYHSLAQTVYTQLGLAPPTPTPTHMPTISNMGFVSLDETEIMDIGNNVTLRGYVDVDNRYGVTEDNICSFFVACYIDNKLYYTRTFIASIDANTLSKRVATDILYVPVTDKNVTFKICAWKSFENMIPIIAPQTIVNSPLD